MIPKFNIHCTQSKRKKGYLYIGSEFLQAFLKCFGNWLPLHLQHPYSHENFYLPLKKKKEREFAPGSTINLSNVRSDWLRQTLQCFPAMC